MITSDFHLHTNFSNDSNTLPEHQIQAAISHQLSHICITDHEDFGYPTGEFQLDIPAYTSQMELLREKYSNQIHMEIGIEAACVPIIQRKLQVFYLPIPLTLLLVPVMW